MNKIFFGINLLLLSILVVLVTSVGTVPKPIVTGDTSNTAVVRHIFKQETLLTTPSCTGSMEPTIRCGTSVEIMHYRGEELIIGSIYVFERDGGLIMHRLVGCVDIDCDRLIFKGDATWRVDPVVNRSDVKYLAVKING